MDHAEFNNNTTGIVVTDTDATSLLRLTLADSIVSNNSGDGVYIGQVPQANAIIINTNASFNAFDGFHLDGGYGRLTRSAAYGNAIGVEITRGSTVESYGDNEFVGNSGNVVGGTLAPPTGAR